VGASDSHGSTTTAILTGKVRSTGMNSSSGFHWGKVEAAQKVSFYSQGGEREVAAFAGEVTQRRGAGQVGGEKVLPGMLNAQKRGCLCGCQVGPSWHGEKMHTG
jgi:hypothetical protein